MKKLNVAYWIITAIFAAFMIFSAIPDLMVSEDAVKVISTGLGYPHYIIVFLGVAKLLGAITILVPGFKSLKEWAYAGLFFDLFGATYSIISTGGLNVQVTFMILPLLFLFLSYYLWKQRLKPAK